MGTNKSIGTSFETAIVKYLIECGFKSARRVPLAGRNDCGDIHLGEPNYPRFVIEAKSRKIETPYKMVEGFVEEAVKEYLNVYHTTQMSKKINALVVIKRPNLGVQDSWLVWKNLYNITMRCRLCDMINKDIFSKYRCNTEEEKFILLEKMLKNIRISQYEE